MTIKIHHPHDKYFKQSLKNKKVAIDFLKTYLPSNIYQKIDIHSLQLTEKSFIVPQLREIHSDIIYKCLINDSTGYLFFLLEHQSTDDPLMAFRFLHAIVSLSYEHLKQGYKKLPIILPFCIYHGEKSPYPYSTSLYDCFDDSEFAKEIAFRPFKLIDLTVLSDEEIKTHGLVGLMEMLFKHQRDKNFLSIMRKLLESQFVQNIIKQLNISYLTDMLNYIVNTSQDDSEPKAAQHLIEELIKAFPEEPARKTIMTFAQQLKQEGLQQGLQQGREQGLEEGIHLNALTIAKKLIAEGKSIQYIQDLTNLSENEIIGLVDLAKS